MSQNISTTTLKKVEILLKYILIPKYSYFFPILKVGASPESSIRRWAWGIIIIIKLFRLDILHKYFALRFVGNPPLVFKPGMPFEGAVAVRYHDQVRQWICLAHFISTYLIFNVRSNYRRKDWKTLSLRLLCERKIRGAGSASCRGSKCQESSQISSMFSRQVSNLTIIIILRILMLVLCLTLRT